MHTHCQMTTNRLNYKHTLIKLTQDWTGAVVFSTGMSIFIASIFCVLEREGEGGRGREREGERKRQREREMIVVYFCLAMNEKVQGTHLRRSHLFY